MTRYWIFDREDTPQGYPLQKLVRCIRETLGTRGCQFAIRRSEGYGATVNEWGEQLELQSQVLVEPEHLEHLSAGTEEWFYNLEAVCIGESQVIVLRFGLHDSSALFVDASLELSGKIAGSFQDIQLEKNEGPGARDCSDERK